MEIIQQKKIRKVLNISIFGDSNTGKTQIIRSLLGETFDEPSPTSGSYKYILRLKNPEIILKLIDTPGQERYREIVFDSLDHSQGAVLVFNLTNRETFLNLPNWLNEVKKNKNLAIILFGNACEDIRRVITREEAENIAKKYNLSYFEVSAMKNINIKSGFKSLVNEIIEQSLQQYENSNSKRFKNKPLLYKYINF